MSFLGDMFGGGGLIPGLGSLWQTDKSADMADHAMDFSRDEAANNRAFQKDMSNTAWQRGTADMMAAGINPMLAFMKGGASTPPGGQGSGFTGSASNPGEAYMTGANSAAQIANLNEQNEKIKADTALARNQARIQDATVDQLQAQTHQLAKQNDLTEAQTDQVRQVIENLKREWQNLGTKGVQMEEQTVLTALEQSLTKLHIQDTRVRITLHLLDIPEALAKAKEMMGTLGKVKPYVSALGGLVSSASEAKRAFSPATQSYRRNR